MTAATAKLIWATSDRLHLKLKANGVVALNAVYETAPPLPDDLTIFDEDGDAISNASFVDIQQHYSIQYRGVRYYFKEVVGERPRCLQSIFTDGLPELGPLSETTHFTTNLSVPTNDQFAPADIQISTLAALSDLGELPHPKTNIWNQLDGTGTLGGYSTEADVNKHVEKVIVDILESLRIRKFVEKWK